MYSALQNSWVRGWDRASRGAGGAREAQLRRRINLLPWNFTTQCKALKKSCMSETHTHTYTHTTYYPFYLTAVCSCKGATLNRSVFYLWRRKRSAHDISSRIRLYQHWYTLIIEKASHRLLAFQYCSWYTLLVVAIGCPWLRVRRTSRFHRVFHKSKEGWKLFTTWDIQYC